MVQENALPKSIESMRLSLEQQLKKNYVAINNMVDQLNTIDEHQLSHVNDLLQETGYAKEIKRINTAMKALHGNMQNVVLSSEDKTQSHQSE